MNRQDYDILYTLQKHPFTSQRALSELSGYSLGAVNKTLKNLLNENYITSEYQLTNANYAQTECQFRYCGTAIPFLTVRSTAR